MPQMIQMRAVVAFERNGKHLKIGDLFTAYPLEAASLRYNRKAVFHQGPMTPAPPSYGTRAMTAATPGAAPPPPPAETTREQAPAQSAEAEASQTAEAESTQTTEGGRRRAGRSQGYSNRSMRTNSSEG